MNSDWRATPSSYGLLRSRGRKIKSCSVCCQLGTCCFPPSAFSACFTCPLANPCLFREAVEQQIGGEVEQRSSEWSWRFAGRPLWVALSTEAGKGWGWSRWKGVATLKKKTTWDGWRTGVGKGVKTIYQGWLERWYSQVYSSAFELNCSMIKTPILDFLRAVWQSQLKITRDFCSVNDC